jgi:hypothetical protein
MMQNYNNQYEDGQYGNYAFHAQANLMAGPGS